MDYRSSVLYLNRKDLTPQVIHDDLVATLGAKAIAYSTVTNYLRAARTIPRDATPFEAATSPHIDKSDEAILRALEESAFSSVRQLSRATHLLKTTIYRRLSEKLGFPARHLRWVPHILSDNPKAKRVQCSQSLLMILRAQETRDETDTTLSSWMSHGSITLQIMNLYDCLLMEKFRIGNVSQFTPEK
jgi:hypothetical protein